MPAPLEQLVNLKAKIEAAGWQSEQMNFGNITGFAETLPLNGQVMSIPAAGRLAAIENSEAFNDAVRDFWNSIS